jgi:hypothetical protein
MVGGFLGIIGGRVLAGGGSTLSELEPELVQLLLTPYIGLSEARRIAAGPA